MLESLNSKTEYFHQNVRRIGLNEQQCNSCGRKFELLNELDRHEKQIHTRFKCQECDYLSYGERDLKDHIEIYHGKVDIKCQ